VFPYWKAFGTTSSEFSKLKLSLIGSALFAIQYVSVKALLRCEGHVARMGAMRNAYKILVGKPEGKKRLLGRPRRRWEDNIRMDIREIGWGDVDWIYLAQDRDGTQQ
jgi:hypothetical protein